MLFNLKGFAEEKGLSLDIEWPPGIVWSEEEICLYADRNRVSQIPINLINNALKFTERGGVKVVIKDAVMGMPKEEIEKAFDKFYQVTKPRSAKSRGTGLGLAITETLVEMYGGKIWIKREEGKGSEFCFTLPREDHNEKEDSCCRR